MSVTNLVLSRKLERWLQIVGLIHLTRSWVRSKNVCSMPVVSDSHTSELPGSWLNFPLSNFQPYFRLYSRFLSRIPRTSWLANASTKDFHKYVLDAIQGYKQCFSTWSIRHCAYNGTLFENTVVRRPGMFPGHSFVQLLKHGVKVWNVLSIIQAVPVVNLGPRLSWRKLFQTMRHP